MKRKEEIAWGGIALLLLFAVAVIVGVARADDRIDVRQSNDMNNQSSGDVVTGGNTSKALGLSGGDVDINDCYRSYSYLIIWQDSKPNLLCLARELMAEGNYEAAATLRCKPRSVWRPFGSKDACIAALNKPPKNINAMPEVKVDEHLDEEEEYHEEQQQLYADLMAKIANLEQEVSKPPPRPVQRTVIEQRGGLTDEQKAALREVVK